MKIHPSVWPVFIQEAISKSEIYTFGPSPPPLTPLKRNIQNIKKLTPPPPLLHALAHAHFFISWSEDA